MNPQPQLLRRWLSDHPDCKWPVLTTVAAEICGLTAERCGDKNKATIMGHMLKNIVKEPQIPVQFEKVDLYKATPRKWSFLRFKAPADSERIEAVDMANFLRCVDHAGNPAALAECVYQGHTSSAAQLNVVRQLVSNLHDHPRISHIPCLCPQATEALKRTTEYPEVLLHKALLRSLNTMVKEGAIFLPGLKADHTPPSPLALPAAKKVKKRGTSNAKTVVGRELITAIENAGGFSSPQQRDTVLKQGTPGSVGSHGSSSRTPNNAVTILSLLTTANDRLDGKKGLSDLNLLKLLSELHELAVDDTVKILETKEVGRVTSITSPTEIVVEVEGKRPQTLARASLMHGRDVRVTQYRLTQARKHARATVPGTAYVKPKRRKFFIRRSAFESMLEFVTSPAAVTYLSGNSRSPTRKLSESEKCQLKTVVKGFILINVTPYDLKKCKKVPQIVFSSPHFLRKIPVNFKKGFSRQKQA